MHSDLPGFISNLNELIHATQLSGRSGKVFENLGARSTVNNLITLQNLFNHYHPQHTLEIGLCFGASALLFTSLHQSAGHPPSKQHVALDPFQSSVWDDAGLVQIKRAGLEGYFDFRAAYSCFELPRFLEQGKSFDLIYIDGSHLFEDVFIDAYYSTRLLSEGGIIAFDDCVDPHVAKVIRFLQKNSRDGLEELDLKPFRKDTRSSFLYDFARIMDCIQMRVFRRTGEIRRVWNARLMRF